MAVAALTDPGTSSIPGFGTAAGGSYRTSGFAGALQAGHYFSLWSSSAANIPLLANGWKAAGIELSGHVENFTEYGGGLVTTGTAFGGTQAYDFYIGASAKLSALYKTDAYTFLPYIEVGIDGAPESKLISGIPSTLPFTVGPSVYRVDRTLGLVDGGLEVTTLKGGIGLTASGFYRPAVVSSVGGRISLRVPL